MQMQLLNEQQGQFQSIVKGMDHAAIYTIPLLQTCQWRDSGWLGRIVVDEVIAVTRLWPGMVLLLDPSQRCIQILVGVAIVQKEW